ncbi:probable UDP-sugar transporter protein SLC35A4 [Megalops cyprinoides]|uniref:probable UDP-sugar transporter protein SLC35A4 n=1 Tax=Megalops cyprinoides TaxID=118141 RepID=UPI001863DA52|nr:probable UDP-sugar transporter protein SLC35A4 [Megalops cyprinoides]
MIFIPNVGSDDPSPPRRRWTRAAGWGALLTLSVVIYGSHAPLIALTKVDGRVPFSPSSCVVMIELTKLLVSLALLVTRDLHTLGVSVSWRHVVPYALPALLYALNNNLVVFMQAHMDPSTFQVLSNLKIASTALLYSFCLGKRLRPKQWLALSLLMGAGVCHSYSSLEVEEEGRGGGDAPGIRLHVSAWGLLLVLTYCLISGLAAVYTELILKTQRLPLSLQNLFLYVFGVTVNGAAHVSGATGDRGFLEGYSAAVWVIVAGQATNGLLMAVVMKHGSNITRLFIISCSMLVNTALSWAILGLQLTPIFLLAVLMIGLAAHLYYGT